MTPIEVDILAERVAAAELRLKDKEEKKISLSQHEKELNAVRSACDQLLYEQKQEFEAQNQSLELRVAVLECELQLKEADESRQERRDAEERRLECELQLKEQDQMVVQERRLRLTRRVVTKVLHGKTLLAWEGMRAGFRAHVAHDRALRILCRVLSRCAHRDTLEVWDAITAAFATHRTHQRAFRNTSRILATMMHLELIAAWDHLRTSFSEHQANAAALRRLSRCFWRMHRGFSVELWGRMKEAFLAHQASQRKRLAKARAARMVSRVMARICHGAVLAAWDGLCRRWRNEKEATATRQASLERVVARLTRGRLAQGFDTLRACHTEASRRALIALQVRQRRSGAEKLQRVELTEAMRQTYRALLGLQQNRVAALQVESRYQRMVSGASVSKLNAMLDDAGIRKREVQVEIETERGRRYKLESEKEGLEVKLATVLEESRTKAYRHATDGYQSLLLKLREMESVIHAQKAEIREREKQKLCINCHEELNLFAEDQQPAAPTIASPTTRSPKSEKSRDAEEKCDFMRKMERAIDRIDRWRDPGLQPRR